MNIYEAKIILGNCVKIETVDHIHGDVELEWYGADPETQIAWGLFMGRSRIISFSGGTNFIGMYADELRGYFTKAVEL